MDDFIPIESQNTDNTKSNADYLKKEKKLKKQKFYPVKEKSDINRRARIIIRNLSFKVTEDFLKEFFTKYGEINEVKLLKRPDGKLVGCAFIQYNRVNDAAKAIKHVNSTELLKRKVTVDWALDKTNYSKKNQPKEDKEASVAIKDEIKSENDIKEEKDTINSGNSDNSLSEGESNDEDGSIEDDDSNEGDDLKDDEDDKSNIVVESENVDVKPEKKRSSNDVKEGCTVFIKNVPFDATNHEFRKCCQQFGKVWYALINMDPVSGHSKGTGFVKFKEKESADMCLQAGTEFKLLEQILDPVQALSRDDIRNKAKLNEVKEIADSRNLYLIKEGLIMAGSPAAVGVSASDMAQRIRLEQSKSQLLKNFNRFVSRERLTIHNLPQIIDDGKLRKTVFKQTKLKPAECRVMRENIPSVGFPNGKSKGYGFLSFKSHEDALLCLRKLNNNPNVFGAKNRPIVSFSIEDKKVMNIKLKRLEKSRINNPNKMENLTKKSKKQKGKKLKTDKQIINTKSIDRSHANCDVVVDGKVKHDSYAGTTSIKGTKTNMRSNKKITEQVQEHMTRITMDKKLQKKLKQKKQLIADRRVNNTNKQIHTKLMKNSLIKKKNLTKDNFSAMVGNYKKIINSAASALDNNKNPKRTKWYVD